MSTVDGRRQRKPCDVALQLTGHWGERSARLFGLQGSYVVRSAVRERSRKDTNALHVSPQHRVAPSRQGLHPAQTHSGGGIITGAPLRLYATIVGFSDEYYNNICLQSLLGC